MATSDPPSSERSGRQKSVGKPSDRGQRGRFAPGNKLGKGRPKGTRNKASILVEQMLEGELEAMTQKLIEKVLGGSTEAMKIVFAILAPPRKDRLIEIALPNIDSMEDLVLAHGAIIKAVAQGEIAPSEGHAVAVLLDLRRRAVEAIEIEARLATIEARFAEHKISQNGFGTH